MYGSSERPRERPPTPSCPILPDVLAYHRRDNLPGQIRAQIRPPGPSAKITQGARPCDRNPAMQPNTVNNHHDTDPPVPPELLEAVARALAAALIPPPRRAPPPETEEGADFLTAAQLARRLGVSERQSGGWPSPGRCRTPWCAKAPARPPPLSPAVRRGVRGQRPGGSRPGRIRRCLAGAGDRARTVTGRPPRHRTLAAPARFAARWRELAACRGAGLDLFFPERGESAGPARRVCAACPVRQPCLDYAISNRITHGIWGGLTERERRALRSGWVRPRGGSVTRRSWPPKRPGTRRRRSAARSACPVRR